jgi:hypothetical protein
MFAGLSGLDLAIGIKEMLVNNGFTSLEALLRMPPAELALILGIDLYVARLIYLAAKQHAKMDEVQYTINDEAFIKLDQKGNREKLSELAASAKHILRF